jgi:hypothetical protein
VALLADVAGSRRLSSNERASLQTQLDGLMKYLNRAYRHSISAAFLITLGDEFQGILKDETQVVAIVQDIHEHLPDLPVRIAVSRGRLSTPLKKTAIGTDGPIWHSARDLVGELRKSDRYGAAFVGFGRTRDVVLTAIAGLLTGHWSRLRNSQRAIIAQYWHEPDTPKKRLAEKLGLTQQALSNRARSSGWRAYVAGLKAMQLAIGAPGKSDDD